jgi:GntR family transcriptional regulator, transcriptional repressor for pyruvate dehydrogenase complex
MTPDASELVEGLFETERPGGLHKRVYRSLAHAIASGKFARGSRLPSELELASTYSVSRPVLRQALVRLREEGAIQSLRGSGNYVARPGGLLGARTLPPRRSQVAMRQLLDDLEFRMVIEPEAAGLAARRRSAEQLARIERALRRFEEAHANGAVTHHFDYRFHEAIALASGNPRFVEAVRTLEYSADDERTLLRHLVHFQPTARGSRIIAEHAEVLELIRKQRPGAARAAMKAHINSARLRLTKSLRNAKNPEA